MADDIIGPTGDVMTLNGHYPYTEKVHSTKYHFTIIFNPPPLFSFYRLIDKGFGILIFILLIACAAAFLLDRYFNMKWHTEFGHLNRGDMLTSEQHRCSNEKKKF